MKAEILKRVGDAVMKVVGEECEISFPEVTKNNSCVRQVVVIRRFRDTTYPVIYIDRLLDEIESGCKSIQDAAEEIVDIYRNEDIQKFSDLTKELSKESILENVIYQLINTERNVGKLCNMPHKELLDLSAIYSLTVEENNDGISAIAMNYDLCGKYAISEEELEFAARRNTKERGFCVTTMEEIIAEMMGIPVEGVHNTHPSMFVLTNTSRINGAVVMLYEEYFKELAEKVKSDLYVIPSSIHEVIAVSVDGLDLDEIRKMVCEVNTEEVADEEILGESVYRYKLETGELEIAYNGGDYDRYGQKV